MPRQGSLLAAVRGSSARVTRLDGCGRTIYGEYSQAVTEGIVTAAFTANSTETEEINVVNFGGRRRIYEPSTAELAGYALTLTFADVDFETFEIITGQTLVFDAFGRVVGLEIDTGIPVDDNGFALEIWVDAQGSDVCDDPNAQGEWGYLLLPRLEGGIVGDFEVGNGAVSFTITGANTVEGNRWGNGPYLVEMGVGDVPSVLFQAVSQTAALRMQVVTVAPPQEVIGARPLLDPAGDPFTSISAVEGSTTMEADFTTTPAATAPTWWDFGDTEWDYVAAPGSASHVYATAGTYTARASQNGIDWETVSVTVPFV